jgi:ubiquinone/menaquinone biosynthesis C-methylase UbiE
VFSYEHLDALRATEIDRIATFFPAGAHILDVGVGTGKQAFELRRHGFDVTAIEIQDSKYAARRVFPSIDYDGATHSVA